MTHRGVFYSSLMGHPEARRAEGSYKILRRFAPQDDGSGNIPARQME